MLEKYFLWLCDTEYTNRCYFSVISTIKPYYIKLYCDWLIDVMIRDKPLNQMSFIITDLHKSTDIKEQVVYGWNGNKKKKNNSRYSIIQFKVHLVKG